MLFFLENSKQLLRVPWIPDLRKIFTNLKIWNDVVL